MTWTPSEAMTDTCGCLSVSSTTFCMGALSVYCLPRLHPHHQAYAGGEVGKNQDGEGAFHAGLVSTEVVTPRATIRNILCSLGVSLNIRQIPTWAIM